MRDVCPRFFGCAVTFGFLIGLSYPAIADEFKPCALKYAEPVFWQDNGLGIRGIGDICATTNSRPLTKHPHGEDVNRIARNLHEVALLQAMPDGTSNSKKTTGTGIDVAMWDIGLPQRNHPWIKKRILYFDPTGKELVTNHATHVAGTIAADRDETTEGMARNARIISFDWQDDLKEMKVAADYDALKISISNHSYGYDSGWVYAYTPCDNSHPDIEWSWVGRPGDKESIYFGRYLQRTHDFDAFTFEYPNISVVIAAGNERSYAGPNTADQAISVPHCVLDAQGNWTMSNVLRARDDAKAGSDTISGAALAKNVITVGALKPDPTGKDAEPHSFSSWGPADDGRIKPDVVADGEGLFSLALPAECDFGCKQTAIGDGALPRFKKMTGTSMAAPVVSGIAALLNELALKNRDLDWQDESPLVGKRATLFADEMKAVLIHSAKSIGGLKVPNHQIGWGRVSAGAAGDVVLGRRAQRLVRVALKKGSICRGDVTLTNSDMSARITLVWLDTPGKVHPIANSKVNANTPALKNDLDLSLRQNEGDAIYYPWRLDLANLAKPLKNGVNRVDNVERIDIDDFPTGTDPKGWSIRIDTSRQMTGTINAALAFSNFIPKYKDQRWIICDAT